MRIAPRHPRHWFYVIIAVLLGVVFVGLVSIFFQQLRTQEELCRGAAETRTSLREVVKGVRSLGNDLVLGEKPEPTTIEEAAAIQRINLFADQQLAALELPICER